MTAFLASKVQRERGLAHLRGIRPRDARKSMGPWLSPSTASSYPDWLLSLLPSTASWARLGRVCCVPGCCDRVAGGRPRAIIVVLMAAIRSTVGKSGFNSIRWPLVLHSWQFNFQGSLHLHIFHRDQMHFLMI